MIDTSTTVPYQFVSRATGGVVELIEVAHIASRAVPDTNGLKRRLGAAIIIGLAPAEAPCHIVADMLIAAIEMEKGPDALGNMPCGWELCSMRYMTGLPQIEIIEMMEFGKLAACEVLRKFSFRLFNN